MSAKMKTGNKVLAGFGFAVLIALLVGRFGYRGISSLSGHVDALGNVRLPSVEALQNVKIGAEQIESTQRTLLNLNLAPAIRQRQLDIIAKANENCDASCKHYEPLPHTPEDAEFGPTTPSSRASTATSSAA